MFFNVHPEGKIGYKRLSDADLGRGTSHQTHIGLYDDILTFLHNREVEEEAMFIFNGNSCMLDCYFDRIENPNGSFRSPKIKKGGKDAVSVVTVIRDYVRSSPSDYTWYLIWFGLESEKLVFYLFNNHMNDFRAISPFIDFNKSGRLDKNNQGFSGLMKHLEDIVNNCGTDIIQELEIASQVGSTRKFRPFDLDKANLLFKETGRLGEERVAEYLEKLKFAGNIVNYIWENKNQESGAPFDFRIQELNQNIVHVDVKATQYKFEQQMIFSGQEIEFISQVPYFHLFRVYDLSNEEHHLRVCENSKVFVPNIQTCISNFRNNIIALKSDVQSVKLAISPTIEELIFRQEILL